MNARLLVLLTSFASLGTGCLGDYGGIDNSNGSNNGDNTGGSGGGTGGGAGGGSGGGSGGGGGGGGTVDVVADFNTKVAPILVGADGKSGSCGACHAVTGGVGPSFLVPKPDLYTTVTTYPALIGAAPASSLIYTKGSHEGPAFDTTQDPVIAAWIVEYAQFKSTQMPDGGVVAPTVAPFVPVIGANTIDLSVLDPKLAGQSITFTAKMVGTTSIELQQLSIKTAATMGVHLVHPLWVSWDAMGNAMPDPGDSFSNLDQSVAMATTAAMGPGTMVLPGFSTGMKINVVFKVIEAKNVTVTQSGCKALANFTANVKPLLQANCNTCHVGANPTAQLSWDFTLNTDAVVCANALTEINTTTPANSLLLQRPNPAVADMHPKKLANFAAYQTAVTNWINLEK